MQNMFCGKDMVELEAVWVQLLAVLQLFLLDAHICEVNLNFCCNALENSRISYEHLSSS